MGAKKVCVENSKRNSKNEGTFYFRNFIVHSFEEAQRLRKLVISRREFNEIEEYDTLKRKINFLGDASEDDMDKQDICMTPKINVHYRRYNLPSTSADSSDDDEREYNEIKKYAVKRKISFVDDSSEEETIPCFVIKNKPKLWTRNFLDDTFYNSEQEKEPKQESECIPSKREKEWWEESDSSEEETEQQKRCKPSRNRRRKCRRPSKREIVNRLH